MNNRREGFEYQVIDSEIKVRVKSIAENLLSTNSRDVTVNIDLANYSQGEYHIPISVGFPPDILVVEEPKIKVRISKIEPEEPIPEEDPELDQNLNPEPEGDGTPSPEASGETEE